ncbi:hypothetical protein DRO56_01905 [Candidatus Bathyarchaeota archaeon]|mgnify:CR=1 FL=1|nr:MAG: hypothetical protein DRO56_01905 [Candidatus Bathyarchaeota archaeon]
MLKTDVLVIGGGAAGLRASIEAKRMGAEVVLASKAPAGYSSSTLYAGGGFRAALGGYSKEEHLEDTLLGGKLLNDRELVERMVLDAPDRLLELRRFGVEVKVRKGGVRVSDGPLTAGRGLISPLAEYAKRMGVAFVEGVMAVDIIVDDSAHGAVFFDVKRGRVFPIISKAVVLATGGYSQLFAKTDNPVRVSGDGCAMALRAGATLIDLEFTQFFPLGLAERGPAWLFPALSGRLVNRLGEDVLMKHGINKPLSRAAIENRDLLSRAMWTEISEGRGEDGALIVDMRHGPPGNLPPSASHLARLLNMRGPRFRVAPTAHFTMGGVKIDVDCRTTVPGLFACGEVSGGVHGANRLGGNALTEAIVFGSIAGREAAKWAEARRLSTPDDSQIKGVEEFISKVKDGKRSINELRGKLKREMWAKCGVIRDGEGLKDLLAFIGEGKELVEEASAESNFDVMKALELRNMFELAEVVALSALGREESRGAHYRRDFPEERDDLWMKRIAISMINRRPSLNFLPVK